MPETAGKICQETILVRIRFTEHFYEDTILGKTLKIDSFTFLETYFLNDYTIVPDMSLNRMTLTLINTAIAERGCAAAGERYCPF